MADERQTSRSANVLGYESRPEEWDEPYNYPPVDSPLWQGNWLGWVSLVFLVVGFPIWLMFWPVIFVSFGLGLGSCILSKGRCVPGWIGLVISGMCICGFSLIYLFL